MAKAPEISENIRIFSSEDVLMMNPQHRIWTTERKYDVLLEVPLIAVKREPFLNLHKNRNAAAEALDDAIAFTRKHRVDICATFIASLEGIAQAGEDTSKVLRDFLNIQLDELASRKHVVLEELHLYSLWEHQTHEQKQRFPDLEATLRAQLLSMPDELTILNEAGIDFFIQQREHQTDKQTSTFHLGLRQKDTGFIRELGYNLSTRHIIILHADSLDKDTVQHEVTHQMARFMHRMDSDKKYIEAVIKDLPSDAENGAWGVLTLVGKNMRQNTYDPSKYPKELMAEMGQLVQMIQPPEMVEPILSTVFPNSFPFYQNFREILASTASFLRRDGMDGPQAVQALASLKPENEVENITEWTPGEAPKTPQL